MSAYLDPPPMPAAVVIQKDVGGLVSSYRAQTEIFRAENREVRLHECRSACTLALSLPNVCVYPSSLVKFHQAYNALTKEVDLGISDELWRSYPEPVRARLGNLTRSYKVLTGAELIAMGVRNCRDGEIMIARNKQRPGQGQTQVASAAPRPAEQPQGFTTLVAGLFGSITKAPADTTPVASVTQASVKRTQPVLPPSVLAYANVPLPPTDRPRPHEINASQIIEARLNPPVTATPNMLDDASPRISGLPISPPLPPRRPAFEMAEATFKPLAPKPGLSRLIVGAAPILPSTFVAFAWRLR